MSSKPLRVYLSRFNSACQRYLEGSFSKLKFRNCLRFRN